MRISVLLPIFFLLALSNLLPGSRAQSIPDENTRVLAALGAGAKPPVFNAYFPVDPTPLVGVSQLNYTWYATDPADSAAVSAYHTGVASLSGAANSFIDVGTTTGANSCGVKLPDIIGGAGSGSGATQGWSVDLVVKLTIKSGGWAKLIDFGDGPYADGSTVNDLTITWDGNDNNENGRMEGLAVQQLSSPPPATQYNYASFPMIKPQLNTWYHITLVMQAVNVSAASATWYVYVNGMLLPYSTAIQSGASFTSLQGANLPLPVLRPQSYIGKSDYGDPTLTANFDAVRVYDYALSATQASALAAAYNLNIGVALPQPSDSKALPSTSETNYWQNAEISRAPVLNAVFPADPTSVIGTAPLYKWSATDSSDNSATAALHQGVVQLTGTTDSFVDLTMPAGGNSVGLVMGTFGGAGCSAGAAMGWTVEMVVKPQQNGPYTKLLSIGNGGYLDVFFVGWDSEGQKLQVSQSNNININLPGTVGNADVFINQAIPLGQWLHMSVVMQPTSMALYTGRITVYINGQLAAVTSSNSNLTQQTYPLPTYRDQTYIGASDYQDPNAVATYDAVRVYDQALTQRQVQLMAQQYGLLTGAVVAASGNSDSNSNTCGGGSGSSGISKGGIAGAVIGSIVGAMLLCALLAFVCVKRRGGGGQKSLNTPTNTGVKGKGATYGDMDTEQSSTSPRAVELA